MTKLKIKARKTIAKKFATKLAVNDRFRKEVLDCDEQELRIKLELKTKIEAEVMRELALDMDHASTLFEYGKET